MTTDDMLAVLELYDQRKRQRARPAHCPHCDEPLSEAEIKRLWASYCGGKRSAESRAKPWAKHSEKAGKKCRCESCGRFREIRRAEAARVAPPKLPPREPVELTWEELTRPDLGDGYEALIRHEASKLAAKRRNQLGARIANEKFKEKMRSLRKRAEKEGLWDKIQAEAKARCESESSEAD